VQALPANNEKRNDRFRNDQQATPWVVHLAFTLIARHHYRDYSGHGI
jgi:hypothetical protein